MAKNVFADMYNAIETRQKINMIEFVLGIVVIFTAYYVYGAYMVSDATPENKRYAKYAYYAFLLAMILYFFM
jgi:hypothetical protein